MIERLENNFKTHAYLSIGLLSSLTLLALHFSFPIPFLIFLFFICYELLIFGMYFFRYKGSYRNKLYSPLLVNHKLYGYGYINNFDSKSYNKLLFDKYLFKSNRISEDLTKNIKDRIDITINNGFRGEKIKNNAIKIFCCGGSTTACDGCDDDETWPYYLGKKIAKDNHNFQVINAGTQGWYSYQDLLKIKNEIVSHSPKVIILHQGWNEEFEFSSQGLGRDWSPRKARDYIAANVTYTNKKQSSAINRLISIFLIKRFYYFFYKFKNNMSFTNPDRWNVLKSRKYLDAWFDVLSDIIEIANEQNILLFMIDPPCLVDSEDSKMNRKIYLENSRLDRWFANYQSISSQKISYFLSKVKLFIPVINTKDSFRNFIGLDRLRYFIDEIHLSPKGNEALSDSIYVFLKQDQNFQAILRGDDNFKKIDVDNFKLIKNNAISNSLKVDKLIDINIENILSMKNKAKNMIPKDRYTTF